MSENTKNLLLLDFPIYQQKSQLEALFKIHNIIEYDSLTVIKITTQILSKTKIFEEHYLINDVQYKNLETDPDILNLIPNKKLRSNLSRCLILFAILYKYCLQPNSKDLFF
jgi:hypothetical protein